MDKTDWTAEKQSLVRAVVARLCEIQNGRRLSDRQLVNEYPDLGSTKTWRQRLVAFDWQSLNPDRIPIRMTRIAAILDGGSPDTPFFKEMPFARELTALLGALERSTSDRRILVALAPNGCGKTTVAKWAVAQSPSSRAYCRIRPAWRNKELHICNGILRALGSDEAHANASEAEQALINMLSGQGRTIFVDQAHEGGPALMHLLRALVDETPARWVYLGYDTAFRRVQMANTDAMIEAQAFLGRCLKPIFNVYRTGTQVRDVTVYLQRSGGLTQTTAQSVAQRITPVLAQTTNLRLLDDAIAAARAGHEQDEATADAIVNAVHHLSQVAPRAMPSGTADGEEA